MQNFSYPSICWKSHSGKKKKKFDKFSLHFPDISVSQLMGQQEKLLYRKLGEK